MQLRKIIDEERIKKIEKLYNELTPDNEFEFMFYNYSEDKSNRFNLEKYMAVLEYMSSRGQLEKDISLDINCSRKIISIKETNNTSMLRMSVYGIKNVNKYVNILSNKTNPMILNFLSNVDDENIKIIEKNKNKDKIIDIDEMSLRVRVSEEKNINKDSLKNNYIIENGSINFRYKERATLYIKKTQKTIIKIDITVVKQTSNINDINKVAPRYELEIEIMTSERTKDLDLIFIEAEKIYKVIQESNFIISRIIKNKVLDNYRAILGIKETLNTLYARQPISLEIRHAINILPNKYMVTDKADGKRYFMIINEMKVYLISSNLDVKYTGIEISLKKYDNTVFDGEYIFLPEENRHLFLVFDCLRVGENDMRNQESFYLRIKEASNVINDCFIFKNQQKQIIKEYAGEYNIDGITKFNEKQMMENMDRLNHDIKETKHELLIRAKYFINVQGVEDNEIFKYSVLFWNTYLFNSNLKCPYNLDGLIYQPAIEKYVVNRRDIKLFEYKWKPPANNTIDFYIEFKKDEQNKIMKIFDNTNDESTENKPYVMCYLFVGKKLKTEEIPILFNEDKNEHFTYLYLDKNENVVDIEENLIHDKTVVEFYYDTKIEDKRNRWVPLRTRYEKTESVIMFKKKYGNDNITAQRVWNSIIHPILISDIELLANNKEYKKHLVVLQKKEDMKQSNKNMYYQIRENIAMPMRSFHNYIKTDLINKYCKNKIVLDYGCGLGGDILKYYYAKVKLYVGFDVDAHGIYAPGDGAISRYNKFKRNENKYPDFPEMYFINADGSMILDYEQQKNVMKSMSVTNIEFIKKYLSDNMKYDVISCQFAIHYFLKNPIIWNNFCSNINKFLKKSGILMFTTFDSDELLKLLGNNEEYASTYITNDGIKRTFFEIHKKWDVSDEITFGYQIDIYNSWISEKNVFVTEYLVNKNFVVDELKNKCKLKLIESKLFSEIYKDKKQTILNDKTSQQRELLIKYYDQQDEIDKISLTITNLNRYYVFEKIDN